MRKKLGLGAGFALTAAAIAIAGCGSKKTTIVNGTNGELNNNGFPASSIGTNNLATDGGGFSENNQDSSVNRIKVVFNNKRADDASANSSVDGSAMVFFTTTSKAGTPSDRELVYVSYWNGSTFTPPVVITGVDRDETIVAGTTKATHVGSVLCIPINSSSFVDGTGTANALARANNGNWLILWDAQTSSPNPLLTISAGGVGSHHTVYATVFIKNLAGQPSATTKLIGNTATTGTPNGATQNMTYGFQATGTEITLPGQRGGFALGETTPVGFVGGFATAANVFRPASDVFSYGAASDTFVHCAGFNASNDTVSGVVAGQKLGTFGGGTAALGATGGITGPTAVTPDDAQYSCGDNTSFIQLFWTQLITSGDTGGSSLTLNQTTGGAATIQLGPNVQFLTANFNLATMTIGGASDPNAITAVKQVPYPSSLNSGLSGRAAFAAQANTNFVTYNNLVFWSFNDSSLQSSVGTTGVFESTISSQVSTVLSVVAVAQGAGGAADISTGANQTDITVLGSSGRHLTTVNTTNVSAGTNFGNEVVGFDGICNSNISGCPIIGPDEGAADVTIFVVGRVTTFTSNAVSTGANNAGNTDNELWAAVLQPTGATAGTLLGTNNPRRVSFNQAELTSTSTFNTTSLGDPVADVKVNLSRDGTYALLGWRQAIGTSAVPTLSLQCAAYRVNVAAVSSGTGAASNANAPTLDQRLSAPITVNSNSAATSATTVAYSGQTNPGFSNLWNGSPVAAYDFQNGFVYKVGFQGLATRTAVLYLYADGTEDRAFVNSINVTLPTTANTAPALSTSGEVELESGAAVPGSSVFVNTGSGLQTIKSTFRFLPGSHGIDGGAIKPNNYSNNNGCSSLRPEEGRAFQPKTVFGTPSAFDRFDMIDAGSTASTSQGDVLIVFSKIVDASQGTNSNSTSGNFFDRQILAVLYSNGTLTGPVILSRNSVENVSTTTTVGTPPGYGAGYPVPTGFRRQIISPVANPLQGSLQSGKGVSPANGSYIYFYDMATTSPAAARGLFTRHFRARTALATNATQPALGDTFFPTTDTTFSSKFVNPVEIDTLDDSDVTFGTALTAGRQAVVIFKQDNHVWGTVTSDGESYTSTGGRSTPFLADNNTSANQAAPSGNTINLYVAPKLDGSTDDNLHGTGLLIVKQDVNLNNRIYVRVMQ